MFREIEATELDEQLSEVYKKSKFFSIGDYEYFIGIIMLDEKYFNDEIG